MLSPPIQDEHGLTPLSVACECGHLEVATVLVQNGANVDYVDKVSPLYVSLAHPVGGDCLITSSSVSDVARYHSTWLC